MNIVMFIIRVILTMALVASVYSEAGIFTAFSMFLIFLALEMQQAIRNIDHSED